jgi:hypothetical protein
MNIPRTRSIGILLVIVIAGLAWALKQAHEIESLRASLPTPAEQARNVALLKDARARAKTLQAKIATLQATGNGFPSTPGQSDVGATDADLDRQSKVKKLVLVELRGQCDVAFAPLFRTLSQSLNLTPTQLAQFKELLMQKQATMLAAATAANQSTGSTREELTAAVSSIDAAIKQSLGDAAYLLYSQYQRTMPQRAATNLVAQSLDYNSPPMTEDQTEKLVAVLAQFPVTEEAPKSVTLGIPKNPFSAEPSTVTPAAVQAAASILSPGQLKALQQVQLEQQTHQQLLSWLAQAQHSIELSRKAETPSP